MFNIPRPWLGNVNVAWTRLFSVCAVLLWCYGLTQDAHAYQIKRVVRGSCVIGLNDEVKPVDLANDGNCDGTLGDGVLGGVDLNVAKSFVLASTSINSGADRRITNVMVVLDGPQALTLSRFSSGTTAVTVEYLVVEFVSGVTVIRGTTTVADTATTKTVVLPQSVTLSKAFPLISVKAFRGAAATDERNLFTAELTTTTNLALVRSETLGAYNVDIHYQVVAFDTSESDVDVQRGTKTIAGATGSITATAPTDFTAVNAAKSSLFFTISPSTLVDGVEDEYNVDGTLSATGDTLTFTRQDTATTDTVTIKWYLVEFKNEAYSLRGRVQGFNVTYCNTGFSSTICDVPISSITTERSLAVVSNSVVEATTNDTSGLDAIAVRSNLASSTVLALRRETTETGTVYASWFVTELPPLNVKSPNGAELWKVGESPSPKIVWEHAAELAKDPDGPGLLTAHRLKIELCKDGATCASPLLIADDVNATVDAGPVVDGEGSYAWAIPNTHPDPGAVQQSVIGNTLRVRITDKELTVRNVDISNANFEIKGRLEVLEPNGTEPAPWATVAATGKLIRWQYWGLMGTCTLSYNLDYDASPTSWIAFPSTVACGTGAAGSTNTSLFWDPVPNYVSKKLRIKIEDNDGPAADVNDLSNANFEIRPSVTVVKPIDLDEWHAGRIRTFEWTPTGSVPLVKIYYRNTGDTGYGTLVTTTAGYAGVSTTTGYTYTCGAGNLCYDWNTIPSTVTRGIQGKVRIEKSDDALVADEGPDFGDGFFTMFASIDVKEPNAGGISWTVGPPSRDIKFDINGTSGVDTVHVYYTKNYGTTPSWVQLTPAGGMSVTACRTNPSPSCTFTWPTVDDAINSDVRIKVADFSNGASIYDVSDNSLSIIGGIAVATPALNQIARIQQSPAFNITWTNYGNIRAGHCPADNAGTPAVDESLCLEIWLATDGLNFTTPLASGQDSTAGLKSYLWTPAAGTAQLPTAKVRVQVPASTSVLGDSPIFKIKANFSALSPGSASGQIHTAETAIPITWSVLPAAQTGTVTLKYDTGAGTFLNVITCQDTVGPDTIGAPEAADGACTWPATQTDLNPLSGTVKVKVELDGDAADVNAMSQYDFRIKGELAFSAATVPTNNAADPRLTWPAGDPIALSWTRKGSGLGNVKLYYSKDGGPDGYVTEIDSAVTKPSSPTNYSWTIPDTVNDGTANPAKNDNIKIKLQSVTYTDVNSIAAQPVTIKGRFISLVPNSAETWYAGDVGDISDNHNIQWTTKGNVTPVDILYTTNNWIGSTSITPLGGISNPGSAFAYSWNVDAPVSNTVKVRVRSTNSPSDVLVSSVGDSTVKGKVKLNSPTAANTGTSALKVSNTHNISWTCFGSGIGTLKLSYASDGVTFGAPFATLQTCTTPQSVWTVPNQIGAANKLKLECESEFAPSNPKCDAVISPAFEIKGTLDVLENTTGPYSASVGTIPVQWKYTGSVGNVELRYDTANGNSGPDLVANSTDDYPNLIATVAANYDPDGPGPLLPCAEGATCQYDWSTPATTGTGFRLKIVPVAPGTAAAADYQTTSFAIKGSIALTRPTGTGAQAGMVWQVGTNEPITWTHTGSLGTINIKYSKNNGVDNYATLIATVPATDLSYTWNSIPSAALNSLDKNSQFKVKLEQVSDPTVTSETTTAIWIRSRLVTLLPNGGETWFSNEARTVTWSTQGLVNTVHIKYSVDGGNTWTGTIATASINDGTEPWTVNAPVDNDIRVRVESADSTNTGIASTDVYASSVSNITVKGKIVINSPSATHVGASALRAANSHNITWTLNGSPGTVKISYDNGAGTFATTIATAYDPSTQSYNPWTIPDQIPGGADNRIRIECEADFPPATGIKKCDAADSGLFEIKGQLDLTAPNNGEVHYVGGAAIPVQWNYRGTLGSLDLRFDTNSGKGADNIAGNADDYPNLIATVAHNYDPDGAGPLLPCAEAATCTYSWTPPATAGIKYRVKLVQVSDTTINDASIGDFAVKGSVTLVRPGKIPASPEMWTVNGAANTIEWTVTGGIPTVDIHLDTASGTGGYTTTVELARTATASPFPWTIPAVLYNGVTSNTCRIRVKDSADPTVYAASTNDFKIKPVLQLTAPNNNTFQWKVGTTYSITWNPPLGDASSLKINFSSDGGITWTDTNPPTAAAKGGLVAATVAAAAGSYGWPVPDIMTNQGVIRISKVGDVEAKDESDSFFYVIGSITSVAPAASVDLPVGTNVPAKTITWSYTGSLGTVTLYYATDGNLATPTWQTIASLISVGIAGSGSYTWDPIPASPSPNVKVKVDSTASANWQTVSGQSSGLNSIVGKVTLNSPDATVTSMVVGGSQVIDWKPEGGVGNVKIEYKYDASAWIELTPVGGVPGAISGVNRTWTWTNIPNTISSNVLIRVSDYSDPTKVNDASTAAHLIKGVLDLQTPDDTPQTFSIGDTIPIQWNKTGTIGNIKVEYSAKGDFTDAVILDPNYPSGLDGLNTFTPAWTAPAKVSESFRVKVSNVGAPVGTELADTSTATFGVRPKITGVTSPALNEVWNVSDTTKVITFSAVCAAKTDLTNPKVRFQYLVAAGVWTDVLTPAGAVAEMDCLNGTNNYTWARGVADEKSEDVKIKVYFVDYASVNLESASFKIRPVITVTAPIATDQLVAGTNYPNLIRWTSTGTKISLVKILYSTDGTSFPDPANVIADNVTVGTGATGLTWNIPATVILTNTARVKVVDTASANVFGQSPLFKLKGGLTLTAPAAGVTWTAASTTNAVTWTFNGTITNVTVTYDSNSGKGADNIAGNADDYPTLIGTKAQTGASGSSSLTWDLSILGTNTTTVTNTGRIKLMDAADSTNVFAESADFKIGTALNITAPENGAVVYAADLSPITWTPGPGTGVTKVKLEYTNNASNASPTWVLITDTAPNTGSYTWNPVPGALADLNNDNKVRISQFDPLNPDVLNVGEGTAFAIKPTLEVTVPGTGSESWNSGSPYTVKWKKKGAVQSVDLSYSSDGSALNYVKINTLAIDVSGAPDVNGEYSYNWTIADATTLTAGFSGKIKAKVVTPTTQTSVEDVQTNSIEVKGAVTLTAPGGTVDPGPGIIMTVGGTYTIQWTKSGAVNNVKLHYSTNGGIAGGGTYPDPTNLIATVPSTPSSYAWPVPDKIGTNLRVRVSDANNANVWDESNNAVTIKGGMQLNVPDLPGIAWTVGSSQTISWTSTGTYPTVEIHYDVDGNFGTTLDTFAILPLSTVTNCTPVSPAITCNGSASWTIPDKIGANTKVRVRDAGNTSVEDFSTNAFKVLGSFTALGSPAAGAIWYVGETTRQIQWTANGTITNVKIEYKTSAGGTWTAIVAGDPGHTIGNNSYTWSGGVPPGVADVKTEDAYVRVSDAAFPEAFLDSAAFRIRPQLTVTAPVATDQLVAGTSYPNLIKWTKTGTTISTVKVLYSTDGSSFPDPANVIASLVTVGTGTTGLSWTIPASVTLTNTAKIRVVDEGNTNVYGDSVAFKLKGGLTLTAPAAGVTWTAASTTNAVTWTFNGTITNVTVTYDSNSGKGADNIAGNADDYPTLIGTKAQTGASGSSILTWDMSTLGTNTTTVTNTGRIKLMDAADSTNVFAESADFKIGTALNITAPEDGYVVYAEATDFDILWNPGPGIGVNDVKIEYTNDASIPTPVWVEIAPAVVKPNIGTYRWSPVPGAVADLQNKNRIRVTQKAPLNLAVTDEGLNFFPIKPTLTVTVPGTGSESWNVGSTQRIKFKKQGAVLKVDVYYSYDGSVLNYVKVNGLAVDISGAPNDGVTGEYWYDWTIADATTLTAGFVGKIKIKVNDPPPQASVEGIQTNAIEVKGSVTLTAPGGTVDPGPGIIMTVGGTYTIQWTKSGAVNNVDLHYSINGGIAGAGTYPSPQLIVGALPSTPSSYTWPAVPDAIGTNLRVRVKDSNNANVWDESDGTFAIKGGATLTAPVASSIWITGDPPNNITWDRNGTIGNVDLFYSVNNGVYQTIATAVPSPTTIGNTYAWTLPTTAIVSANVKVKLDNVNLAAPVISPAFTVKGKLTLTYPDAAAITTTLGDTINVTWDVAGDIGPVKVEYTSDGTIWSLVTTTAPQNGPQPVTLDTAFTVGNLNGTTVATANAKVRISDADDASVIDTSANVVTVKPLLAVTSPVDGTKWVATTNQAITWNYKGSNVTNVKIEYSTDSGTFYQAVQEAEGTINDGIVANDGSFTWAVPDAIMSTPKLKIRLSSIPTADPYAVIVVSNGLAQIIGQLTMVQPDDTTPIKWRINSTGNQILWNATGSVVNAKLDYSVDSGANWLPIVASTPSGAGTNKSYSWNIPATAPIAKNTVRIRVADAADTNVFDVGTAANSLLANFTVTSPAGGEVWVAENTHTIVWTTPVAGVPATVKLEYSLDNGTNWTPIPETYGTANDGIVSNSGSQSVTLGPDLSTSAKGRISDPSDPDSIMVGPAYKIRGDLTLTSPNTGTESWEIQTYNPITWTKKGNIAAVKLQLTKDADAPTPVWEPLNDGETPPRDTQNITLVGPGPYTFNWKIPNEAGITTTKAKVRIVDASDATVYDPSNANFTIKGRVAIGSPNGSETLTVGNSYAITGSVFGPITTVKLFYSTDGLSYPNPVIGCQAVAVVAAAFSCNWSVPDVIGTSLKVRVEDVNNAAVFDNSDATFNVKGTATITAPTTGNVWIAGDPHTIMWDRNGTIGNVDFLYSVNAGPWTSIATTVASPSPTGNTFSWTLPTTGIVSSNVKVRVQGTNLVAPVDSAAFTVKGKLTLTYPDAAGIAVTLGDTINVTWNAAGDIGPVKVEYFDGAIWSTVTTTAPQNGPQSLTFDSAFTTGNLNGTTLATSGAKVRISDPDDATVVDESANAFTVKPLLAVTSPLGGEAWVVGTSQNITWNKKGSNVTTVKIEYSKDNFITSTILFAGSTPNDGMESWSLPDDIQAVPSMKMKISSLPATDPFAVSVLSNGLFKIVGSLTLTAPQATDKWGVGTSQFIKWSRTGSVQNVRIDYATDGINYNPIVATYPGGSGSVGYPWPIPDVAGIVSNTVTVRVSDVVDSSVFHVSPQFKIVPSFTVTAPVLDQRIPVNRTFQITWNRQGQNATVNFYYWKNVLTGAGILIAAGVTNNGVYDWAVPDATELATGFVTSKVRVTYPSDETIFADSPVFKLGAGFTVVAPNTTADKWDIGTGQTIRWSCTSANVAQAKLEYSLDGSTYPYVITATAGNTGVADAERTYAWPAVPDQVSAQFRVKVTAANDTGAFDSSDSNAKIKAFFQVMAPSATTIVLKVGQPYNITWTWNGTVPNVQLDYSLDNFATPPVSITPTTLNDGVFEWTVPDAISSTVKVRVRSTTDVDAMDLSDNNFKIRGDFSVTAPNGDNPATTGVDETELFSIGFPHTITWSTTGTITAVNLQAYTTNSTDPIFRTGLGVVYTDTNPYVIAAALLNTPNGTMNYSWNPVVDLASPTVRIRVVDANDSTVYDDSNANFKVQGSYTVTYPDAANLALNVGSVQAITWNKTGSSITKAHISYSTTGPTGPWISIIESEEGTPNDGIVTNDGLFNWTVPDAISSTSYIKIQDPNDSSVVDLSNNPFKIRGSFSMVTPAGAERWVVNENRIVSWNTTGTIPSVHLAYSKDGFVTSTPIVSSLANTTGLKTYSWTIPNDLSATVRVRVTSASDATVYADSNAFTIDYYQITFEVRDLLSNAHITTLSVSATNTTTPTYTWSASALNSPIVKGLAAGPWSATWSQTNYGDQAVSVVADRDQTVTVLMETKVVHVWEAITEIAYSAGTDTASLASTLRRDGVTVSGASSCEIKFFQPGVATPVQTFTNAAPPDANGFYNFTWNPPTGLQSNIVYNVVSKITMAATGAVISTPRTFTIAQEAALKGVQDQVTQKLDTPLSQVKTDVTNAVNTQLTAQTATLNTKLDQQSTTLTNSLNAQSSTLTTKLDAQNSLITTQLNQQNTAIANSLVSVETQISSKLGSFEQKTDTQINSLSKGVVDINTAGGSLLLSAEQAEATNKRFAGRLMMPNSVLLGEKSVKLIYQADIGLSPLITIITRDTTGKDVNTVEQLKMAPNADRPDTYEYVIDRVSSPPYTPGKVATVIVEAEVFQYDLDPEKKGKKVKNLEVGAFLVESTTLSTLEGLVAGQSGVKNVVQDTLTAVLDLQSNMSNDGAVGQKLEVLKKHIDRIPKAVAEEGGNVKMRQAITDVAQRITQLAGDQGYDFSQLVTKGMEESPTLKDVRKKTDEVVGATEVMQLIMERKLGGTDDPVVHVMYE